MSASVKNMSLYIPHVFANIGKDKIIEAFEKLDIGKIKNIDFVSKMGKNSEAYNAVYIHFENCLIFGPFLCIELFQLIDSL
jgi:hypothetical protein